MNAITHIIAKGYWTKQEEAKVRSMWADGYSASLIAAELPGKTRSAVMGKVHRWNLTGRRVTHRKPTLTGPARKHMLPRPPRPVVARKVAAPRPKRVAPPRKEMAWEPLPGVTPIEFLALTPTTCRWPLGESPFLYCGAHAGHGPYCPAHTSLSEHRP